MTKRFRIFATTLVALGSLALASCCEEDTDENQNIYDTYGFDFTKYTFRFDSKTNKLTEPDIPSIKSSVFMSEVAGSGWEHITTREVLANGKCASEDYYHLLNGASPANLYIDTDSITKFQYLDGVPCRTYCTTAYTYSSKDNSFCAHEDTLQLLQLRKVDKTKSIVVAHKIAEHPTTPPTPVYAISIYEEVSIRTVDQWERDYNKNYFDVIK